jgi:hypothetical protein
MSLNSNLTPLLSNDQSDDQLPLDHSRGRVDVAAAAGARSRRAGRAGARSQDDLADDADGGLRANLVTVGDGLLGGDGGPEGLGLLAPREEWIRSCRGPLPPPVARAAIVRFLLLAFAGVRKKCDLQSGVSRNFTIQKCAKLLPESYTSVGYTI